VWELVRANVPCAVDEVGDPDLFEVVVVISNLLSPHVEQTLNDFGTDLGKVLDLQFSSISITDIKVETLLLLK
jgi:hypothetical protein